jgi:hypothetical protein
MATTYTCPMHPEVTSDQPGRCPKCGMALVPAQGTTTSSPPVSTPDQGLGPLTWQNYVPIIVVISLIALTTVALSWRDVQVGTWTWQASVSYFMIGFFLTFAGFKLMDLTGFAHAYATYDLLAQRWFTYGYIYPFIELGFGLGMILYPAATWLLLAELIVMAFSGLGVARKLARREQFQCACLGTFLKVPLTTVTLLEDFGMAALALLLLIFP